MNSQPHKLIHVVAAIIIHDGKVFASQRGYGAYKDGWEFPGGKIAVCTRYLGFGFIPVSCR